MDQKTVTVAGMSLTGVTVSGEAWRSIHMAKIPSRESSRESSRKNFTSKSYNKKIKLDFGKILEKILGKIFWSCELTSCRFVQCTRRKGGRTSKWTTGLV